MASKYVENSANLKVNTVRLKNTINSLFEMKILSRN